MQSFFVFGLADSSEGAQNRQTDVSAPGSVQDALCLGGQVRRNARFSQDSKIWHISADSQLRLCGNMFPGKCSKMLREVWTWTASFLHCTDRTAVKSPPMTSSSCWLTSESESRSPFCFLQWQFGPFFFTRYLFLILIRPEKSKLQTIPGQLNVTIECVPPDFSSMFPYAKIWTTSIELPALKIVINKRLCA